MSDLIQKMNAITARNLAEPMMVSMSDWNEVVGMVEQKLDQLQKAEARADNCEREARQWRQEARTQSSIVYEIYQELTGRTGEPGDWNGARPLKPAILRKQAEAVEQAQELVSAADSIREMSRACAEYAQRLRQQADELEKAGGEQ